MSPLAILILSLSMSTDAFAAAVARGAAHRPSLTSTFKAALTFGVIEAITPVVGWALGSLASGFVESIDHWIAFGLLGVVGGNMIWQATRAPDEAEADEPRKGRLWGLIGTALGTSIDAGAVGVGLALIDANIWVEKAVVDRLGGAMALRSSSCRSRTVEMSSNDATASARSTLAAGVAPLGPASGRFRKRRRPCRKPGARVRLRARTRRSLGNR